MATYPLYSPFISAGFSLVSLSNSSNQAVANAGGGLIGQSTGDYPVMADYIPASGKSSPQWNYGESFLSFNTSTIGAGETIISCALMVYPTNSSNNHNNDSTFTIEAYAYNWSTPLTTSSWVPGSTLASATMTASFAIGASLANWTSGFHTFTENGTNFKNSINRSGTTYIVIGNNLLRLDSALAGLNQLIFYAPDGGSNPTQEPTLVITTTSAASPSSTLDLLGVG